MIIRTKNNNKYYLSSQKKDILILSPIMAELIENNGEIDKISLVVAKDYTVIAT